MSRSFRKCLLSLVLTSCVSDGGDLSQATQSTPPVKEIKKSLAPVFDPALTWMTALDPLIIAQRIANGRLAESAEGGGITKPQLSDRPTYFHTNEEMLAALQDLAQRYPNLAELIELSPTGEKQRDKVDRSVWLLRLSDKSVPAAKKSKAIFWAGEHSREIVNPELLLRFARDMLSGYGLDATATMFLQTRQIDLVPIVNPDGHRIVERGFTDEEDGDTWHRKTTTPPDGVDPNRNHPFKWGGVGASTSQYAQDYRGPSPGSEVEIMNLRALTHKEMYAIAISFHSYSRLNLFPWGDTTDPTPDDAVFRALAMRYTKFNGYSPIPSVDLYPTTGTTEDGLYGETGGIAMCIETGDTFLQDDDAYAETLQLNLPVIRYAVSIASDPKSLVFGPEVRVATLSGQTLDATAEDMAQRPNSGARCTLSG